MLKIVKMHQKHISQIAELEKQCFHAPWSEKMLTDELNSQIAFYFVAEKGNEVCGYSGMYVTADIANITNIAVSRNHRRQGIADRLLTEICDEAKRQKLSFVTLEVRESNAPAVSLYEKHGFNKEGKRKGYYSDNNEAALIMTLNLSDYA